MFFVEKTLTADDAVSDAGGVITCNVKREYNPKHTRVLVYSPLRGDFLFKAGDEIALNFMPEIRAVKADWSLSFDGVNASFMKGKCDLEFDQSVSARIDSSELKPGFYRLSFSADDGCGKKVRTSVVFGYDVDRIEKVNFLPNDFKGFWEKSLSRNVKVPMNIKRELLKRYTAKEIDVYNKENASIPSWGGTPENLYSEVDLYRISFDSMRENGDVATFHGFLAVPVRGKNEKLPGMLLLPGAGVTQNAAPLDQARHGYVTLMLNIHAMLPDQEKYDAPETYRKYSDGMAIEKDYYNGVIIACVRALDVLALQDEADENKLAVAGGSQGGFLTIAVAGLNPKAKVAVPALAAYGNWSWRNAVADWNKTKSNASEEGFAINFDVDNARAKHYAYYDTMNFAVLVKCPVIMLACLNDGPSPPHTVWNIFRSIPNDKKEIYFSAGTNHDVVLPYEVKAYHFLKKHF